jgi:hypothetical protein
MKNGKRKTENGKRKTENGKWKMENGKERKGKWKGRREYRRVSTPALLTRTSSLPFWASTVLAALATEAASVISSCKNETLSACAIVSCIIFSLYVVVQ